MPYVTPRTPTVTPFCHFLIGRLLRINLPLILSGHLLRHAIGTRHFFRDGGTYANGKGDEQQQRLQS